MVKYCFPETWPNDREQRAHIIGFWLQSEDLLSSVTTRVPPSRLGVASREHLRRRQKHARDQNAERIETVCENVHDSHPIALSLACHVGANVTGTVTERRFPAALIRRGIGRLLCR
jgi:hypothetical protein